MDKIKHKERLFEDMDRIKVCLDDRNLQQVREMYGRWLKDLEAFYDAHDAATQFFDEEQMSADDFWSCFNG